MPKYASQSEASHWRAQRKALSIRRRVGASSDALDGPFPAKPAKMRWRTYRHLQARDAALQERWLLGAAGDLGRFHSRVKRRARIWRTKNWRAPPACATIRNVTTAIDPLTSYGFNRMVVCPVF